MMNSCLLSMHHNPSCCYNHHTTNRISGHCRDTTATFIACYSHTSTQTLVDDAVLYTFITRPYYEKALLSWIFFAGGVFAATQFIVKSIAITPASDIGEQQKCLLQDGPQDDGERDAASAGGIPGKGSTV